MKVLVITVELTAKHTLTNGERKALLRLLSELHYRIQETVEDYIKKTLTTGLVSAFVTKEEHV